MGRWIAWVWLAANLLVELHVARGREAPRVVGTLGDPGPATCLAVDGGALWVGTLGAGLYRLEGEGLVARRVDTAAGLPGNRVQGCVIAGGVLWAATDHGLARMDPGTERPSRVLEGRFTALAAGGGRVVAARGDGTVVSLDAGGRLDGERRLESVATSVAVAPDGAWVAGGASGRVVDDAGRLVADLGVPVRSLAFEGSSWVALRGDGTGMRLDARGAHLEPALDGAVALLPGGRGVPPDGLAEREVVAAAAWQGGTVLATDRGVVKNVGAGWEPLDLGGMPCGDRVVALAWMAGALWVGSFDRGVCRWDGTAWTRFAGPASLPSDRVNDLATDGDRLYVATLAGLAILDADGRADLRTHAQCRGRLKRPCPWFPSVTGVAHDPRTGTVWVADTGALHRVEGARWKHLLDRAGIVSRHLSRVAARDGRVAVGSSDQGLFLVGPDGRFRQVRDRDGLADDWVTDLSFGADGALWVATCTRGVGVLRDGRWRTLTTRDGLVDDYALAVVPVGADAWIGTLGGLTIAGPDGTVSLTVRDGLGGNEVHDVLVVGNRAYLATDGGVTLLEI
jgi:ligand-binding sensor domain-containing protein